VPNIRVLVVDDSVVVRRLVGDVLAADPEIDLVGTAANGRLALSKVEQLRPDIVTMDIEMPELDGVETVRQLRRSGNRVPVIMFSTLTDRGATATLDALAAGATDYVPKPANAGSVGKSMEQVRSSLIPKIKGLAGRPVAPAAVAAPVPAPVPARPSRTVPARGGTGGCDLLVVGCCPPCRGCPCRSPSSSTCPPCSPGSSRPGSTGTCRTRSPRRPRGRCCGPAP
jgi:two-component system chemotaxis response regulator CheB